MKVVKTFDVQEDPVRLNLYKMVVRSNGREVKAVSMPSRLECIEALKRAGY
jgi:hypothetical protein